MPNSQHYEIVSTYHFLTRKAKHHRKVLEQFTRQWRNEYLLALPEQMSIKMRDNRNPEIATGDIVRNDQTKRIFWELGKVEELLGGEDGIPMLLSSEFFVKMQIIPSCYDVQSNI